MRKIEGYDDHLRSTKSFTPNYLWCSVCLQSTAPTVIKSYCDFFQNMRQSAVGQFLILSSGRLLMFRMRPYSCRIMLIMMVLITMPACSPQDEESSRNNAPVAAGKAPATTSPEPASSDKTRPDQSDEASPNTISGDKPLLSENDGLSALQEELDRTGETLNSARQENEELSTRIKRLERLFQEQNRQMKLKDEQLSDLLKKIKDNNAPKE